MTLQPQPPVGPEFIAEHTGPEVYLPTPSVLTGRSARIVEETVRRLGLPDEDSRR